MPDIVGAPVQAICRALRICLKGNIVVGMPPEHRDEALHFGPFTLRPKLKILLAGGNRVSLGGRAVEILIVLVESAGEVVSKADIMSTVWPDTLVDESNLRVHVAALRKALGQEQSIEQYILNIAGRGYSFVGAVTRSHQISMQALHLRQDPDSNVTGTHRLIGRDEVIDTLTAQFADHHLVTIVGPGGIGKTSVAGVVGSRLGTRYDYRVGQVWLASINDPTEIPRLVATSLGLSLPPGDAFDGLIASLRDQRLLLILDNCEHLVAHIAIFIERVMMQAPDIHILTTSREPIQIDDETVFRLGPLSLPPLETDLPESQLRAFSAVQLFVRRAEASRGTQISEHDVRAAAMLCTRLDGHPLAIEMVAGHVGLFGLQPLSKLLDDRLLMAVKGHRTAEARQQTLREAIEWSYALLDSDEQNLLLQLGTFPMSFTADQVAALGGQSRSAHGRCLELLISLTGKSLVLAETSGSDMLYRLLWVTRAFASQKLAGFGESRKASIDVPPDSARALPILQ